MKMLLLFAVALSISSCTHASKHEEHKFGYERAEEEGRITLSPPSNAPADLTVVQTTADDLFTFALYRKEGVAAHGIRLRRPTRPTVGKVLTVVGSDTPDDSQIIGTANLDQNDPEVTGTITFTKVPADAKNLQQVAADFDLKSGNLHLVGHAEGLTYTCKADPECHEFTVPTQPSPSP